MLVCMVFLLIMQADELRQEYLSRQEKLVQASVRRLSLMASSVRKKIAMASRAAL